MARSEPGSTTIVGLGPLAYDEIETLSERREATLGGGVTYFALAASLYGPVRLVGAAGDDLAEGDLDRLRRRGIDTAHVERLPGRTLRWRGVYGGGPGVAETRNVDLGVSARWHPRITTSDLAGAAAAFIANMHPAIQLDVLARLRAAAVRLVALDTMHHWIAAERAAVWRAIGKADLVFLNEAELRLVTGEADVDRGASRVATACGRAVVVKRGALGARLYPRRGSPYDVPALPAAVRDPTGAGDCLAGGLLGRLAQADPRDRTSPATLWEALRHGVACAALAVEGLGIEGIERASIEAVGNRLAAAGVPDA